MREKRIIGLYGINFTKSFSFGKRRRRKQAGGAVPGVRESAFDQV